MTNEWLFLHNDAPRYAVQYLRVAHPMNTVFTAGKTGIFHQTSNFTSCCF